MNELINDLREENEWLKLALEKAEAERDELRESFYERMLSLRGLTPEEACKDCQGSGVKSYGNTSTWRGGIGGQMMTSDVCNKCWGSGNNNEPWTNLKQLRKELEK